MEKTMKLRIQQVYASLRPSEKKTADYILKYDLSGKDLLLEEVADAVQVSQPTVLRFVRALGYKGFRDFKYDVVKEQAIEEVREQGEIELYGFQISREDALKELPGKIVSTSVKMLEETLKSVQIPEYEKAIDAILKAENIVLYSVENSICTANDLLTKLTYLGLNCRMYGDYYLQSVSAGNLTPGDLAIGISYSGYSKNTVEMMQTARQAGATTLVLTNFENAKISEYADILLCASNQQFLYGNTIFSRIPQMALVDMLYVGVLNKDYERLSKRLYKTSSIVAKRAYGQSEEIL